MFWNFSIIEIRISEIITEKKPREFVISHSLKYVIIVGPVIAAFAIMQYCEGVGYYKTRRLSNTTLFTISQYFVLPTLPVSGIFEIATWPPYSRGFHLRTIHLRTIHLWGLSPLGNSLLLAFASRSFHL